MARRARRKSAVASAVAWRGGLFALVWWALGEGSPKGWGWGLAGVAAATLASVTLARPEGPTWRPAALPGFLAFFSWRMLLGGLDVARRAVDPRLPIAPGFLLFELALPEGPAQALLVTAVNLQPGTASVELRAGILRVHMLDSRAPVEPVLRTLELRVARLFGLRITHPER